MHLSDGEIKAFNDRELDTVARRRVEAHLMDCSQCQRKRENLLELSLQTRENLSALEPNTGKPLSSGAARVRLEALIQEKENQTMFDKLFSRKTRPIWVGLAVVLILIVSLSFAPVRAFATNFLGLFRVEQFAVVQIDPENLPQQLDSSTQLESILAQDVQFDKRGDPYTVTDKEQASIEAGFDVRLPEGMNEPLSSLEVQPGGQVAFAVDAAHIQALFNEIGKSDIQIPLGVDGANITLNIPDGVQAQYGDCDFGSHTQWEGNYDPDDAATYRSLDCTTLVQLPSPTISAPPGLNMTEIGEAYLRLLGMSPEEAKSFAQKVDWTTTFVVPLPASGTSYKEVPVDGVMGILITQELNTYPNQYMLMWVKEGIAYVLTGSGNGATAATIARSIK